MSKTAATNNAHGKEVRTTCPYCGVGCGFKAETIGDQIVRQSADGIPQIAVVHGASTAGGTYVPALSDIVVIVREQGYLHLGGPELTFAATGEHIDRETQAGIKDH